MNADRQRPRAVIYCRVSTKEQTSNLSLTTQERECRRLCEREGFNVVRVFIEEGESAKTAHRAQLIELLQFCRSAKPQINFAVVYKIDRLARNTHDHHKIRNVLLAYGTGFRSVTERIESTPQGAFLETILAAAAQLDNDVKAERTKDGMKEAIRQGRYTWPAPIGYVNSGQRSQPSLLIDPERGPLIKLAFSLAATGNQTKSTILDRVTSLGLRTKGGKKLSPQTFNALLTKPVYVGRISSTKWGEEHRGDWEQIVSDEDFWRVQQRYCNKPKAARRSREHPEFPLRRFVRCAACASPLTGSSSRGRTGRYAYYHCAKCGKVRTPRLALETAFIEQLEALQPAGNCLRLFRAIVTDVWKSERQNLELLRLKAARRMKELQQRADRVEQAFLFDRVIDLQSYQSQRDRIREELAVAAVKHGDLRFEELEIEGVLAFAEHVFRNLGSLWIGAESGDKRQLQEALFPSGMVWDGSAFGTAVTIPAFSWLHQVSRTDSSLASPTGFEPVF